MVLAVMLEASECIVDRIQLFSNKDQRHLDGDQKLHPILKQAVDVVATIKPPVHDQFDLRIPENIQFMKQIADCLGIGDITGEFSIVEREVGLLPEDESQIQLRESIMLLVVAILYLPVGL